MVEGALNVLDDNPKGFFLMVEGGAIDWAGHSNLSGRLIEEEGDFLDAVSAVIEWVDTQSSWNDTLLIVTGDHETGYLTGAGSGPGEAGARPKWDALEGRIGEARDGVALEEPHQQPRSRSSPEAPLPRRSRATPTRRTPSAGAMSTTPRSPGRSSK